MRTWRLAAAVALAALAALLAILGHDLLAWRSAFRDGDAALAARPRFAAWTAGTWLPRGVVGQTLALDDDVRLRTAVRAFDVAVRTGRGFDSGETQARARSAAEVRLSDVVARGGAARASQAGDLLGVLVLSGGRVTGGVTADDRAQDAFDAAVRRDTSNVDAKYNLELLLRRTRATSTRRGAGNGAGSRGRGRRGAGAGSPGRGY